MAVSLAVPAAPAAPAPLWIPPSGDRDGNSLLRRATFVARTHDWFGPRFNRDIGIQWVSDTELLHARYSGDRKRDRTFYRLNTRTRRETKLPHLMRTLDKYNEETIDSQSVSPDGKWLLRSYRWADCVVAEVDGPRAYTYPSLDDDTYRQTLWFPDSRRWLEVMRLNGTARRVILHDVRRPKLSRELPLGGRAGVLARLKRITSADSMLALADSSEFVPDTAAPSVVAYKASPLAPGRIEKVAVAPVPEMVRVYQTEISPRGDRIAWTVAIKLSEDQYRTEVWIGDPHGKGMRFVGALTSISDGDPPYLDLEWLPSGKRLAFQWNGLLYTVSTDGNPRGWRPRKAEPARRP